MTESYPVRRREVIRLLASLGVVGLAGPGSTRAAGPETAVTVAAARLRLRLSNPESAMLLGAAYLRERPAEASVAWLAEHLGFGETDATEDAAAHIAERHRDDLRAGRVHHLDKFTFSRTELRLCALLHLADRG